MSEYRVLISCPLIHDAIDDFAGRFAEHDIEYDVPDVDQQFTEAELLEVIDRYDGVLAGDDEFTERVLRSADRLKIIAKWGIGTDNINQKVAEAEDISVRNTPGVFSEEVADVVVAYTIMLARKLHRIDDAVRRGEWHCPRGFSLAGKTFGVVGTGNIGSEVARRADALGMDVLGHDVKSLPDDLLRETDITAVGLAELFEESTFVSLNCSLTPETKELVDATQLNRLGPDGYLINTARGGLVDQDALVKALKDGRVAGAALDVFTREPLPKASPLTDLDSVILGSHNAQNTAEAVADVNRLAVDNLISGLVE